MLTTDAGTALGAQAAWRQIIDLVGRGRAPADAATMAALADLKDRVPAATRAASARALYGMQPPAALVALLARDEMAIAAPVLRGAVMPASDWEQILPGLTPAGRAILRHRRDLPAETMRALESFGAVDFVIGTSVPASAEPAAPVPAEPGPFVSVGQVAAGIIERARRQENDNDAPPPPPQPRADGTFRIADVVARIEAFRRRQDEPRTGAAPAADLPIGETFRFETDANGIIRWIDGAAREAIVGMSIAQPARPGSPGVDGAAAGAFRGRSRIAAARLAIGGLSSSAGDWTITGVPAFDPATGRFIGYRGTARRPHRGERAAHTSPAADSLRQLVHELRTPTNAIAGFSEMIEHQLLGPVTDAHRAQAAAIRDDAARLLAAIEDLDTTARLGTGALPLRPEAVALKPLIARLAGQLAPLADARGAMLTVRTADVIAHADAPALERLLDRLVATMLGAAGEGEEITVKLQPEDPITVRVSVDRPVALANHAGDAVFEIDDETTPASLLGTGFALRLVRNLAAELGGSLRVGDHRLTVVLPAAVDRPMERTTTGLM